MITKCIHCCDEIKVRSNTIYPTCKKPECRKKLAYLRCKLSEERKKHKMVRMCAHCGRYFLPETREHKYEKKENSYCMHPACREYKVIEEKLRAQKYQKEYGSVKYNSHGRDGVPIYAERMCHCGRRIEMNTEWPYSEDAPGEPYRCKVCRNFDATGVSLAERTQCRVDDDWAMA